MKNRREAAPKLRAAYSHYSFTMSFLIASTAPVPQLHVPRGHRAPPPELPKQRRRRHGPHGNLQVDGSQPHTPGMDVAEEASTLLKLLSKHPVAFSTDFNSLKALQKTAWGFLFNDRNKGWTVCVKPEVQSSTQEYTGCHVRTKRPP